MKVLHLFPLPNPPLDEYDIYLTRGHRGDITTALKRIGMRDIRTTYSENERTKITPAQAPI